MKYFFAIFNSNKKKFAGKSEPEQGSHIRNEAEEPHERKGGNSLRQRVASARQFINKHLPESAKSILRPYYKPEKFQSQPEADYKAYQASLEKSFQINKYKGFMSKFLENRNYEDIIFYPSLVTWDIPLFQRPHQIFRELSKRGYMIFFLTPNPKADRVDPIRKINEHLFLIEDIGMLYDLRESPLILWISWTPNIICKEFLHKSRLLYDYIDELDVFAYYCALMENDHKKLIRASDVIVASADNLHSAVSKVRPDVVLAPNGVCVEDFILEHEQIPSDLKPIIGKGRPIVGYYGALAEWLDYNLINFVCKECTDLSFVFIGPRLGGSSDMLKERDNVFLLGPKKYLQLKYYLRYFDVATIPFKVSSIAHSTSPVKLFEYMAGGKPIVTTEMQECKKYSCVLVAKDQEDYISQIRRALSLRYNSDYLNTLNKEAASNTWSSRVDTIINGLRQRAGNLVV